MADRSHVEVVKAGPEALSEWRSTSDAGSLDLSHADLSECDLRELDLRQADLQRADLTNADLSGTNLSDADLARGDMTMARLTGTMLTKANLYRATFTAAELTDTDFTGACFGFTCVSDSDLSKALGLEAVEHLVPSSIGVDTLRRTIRGCGGSLTPSVTDFFHRAGVPVALQEQIQATEATVAHYSCFIAYGAPDESFAKLLEAGLAERGVERWFFPSDAKVGQPTIEEERRARRAAERVLVVCSAEGLGQFGLLREIDETAQEDPHKLISIVKDQGWKLSAYRVERDGRDLKPYLLTNVWCDYSALAEEEFWQRLLDGLGRMS